MTKGDYNDRPSIHFQSLYHDVLTWPLRARHQQVQLVVQGEALLAAQPYLDLLHLFEDEFHGDLTLVFHLQHAPAVRVNCCFQNVQLF